MTFLFALRFVYDIYIWGICTFYSSYSSIKKKIRKLNFTCGRNKSKVAEDALSSLSFTLSEPVKYKKPGDETLTGPYSSWKRLLAHSQILATITAFVVIFIAGLSTVLGDSMKGTADDRFLVVSVNVNQFPNINRGDIVNFYSDSWRERNWDDTMEKTPLYDVYAVYSLFDEKYDPIWLIKRIVGIPGDIIMVEKGHLYDLYKWETSWGTRTVK